MVDVRRTLVALGGTVVFFLAVYWAGVPFWYAGAAGVVGGALAWVGSSND